MEQVVEVPSLAARKLYKHSIIKVLKVGNGLLPKRSNTSGVLNYKIK